MRVLRGGRVVTGTAGDRQRVYVQYPDAGTGAFEGECSCGEPGTCAHVAAVVMVAAGMMGAAAAAAVAGGGVAGGAGASGAGAAATDGVERGTAPRQALCYLIDSVGGVARVSAWVTQTDLGGHVRPGGSPFAQRLCTGKQEYPRYVDALDRDILAALTAQRVEGPWEQAGASGFELFQRVLATGRAFWRSPAGLRLRAAPAREVRFQWTVLPNGDQRLIEDGRPSGEPAETFELLLDLEPAVHVARSGGCGALELSYPTDLLRSLWNRDIDPADVAGVNVALDANPAAVHFPRLRRVALLPRVPSSLRARLVLSAAPQARLYLLYDEIAVDSGTLDVDDPVVRRWDGDALHAITRNPAVERGLRAQLLALMPDAPRDAATWLAFLLSGVPALRAAGWEVVVEPDFPHRLAVADDWYVTLEPAQPRASRAAREWFDLHLGVRVDGQVINLLPALVGYLQASEGEPGGQGDAWSLVMGDQLLVRLEDGCHLPVPLSRLRRIADTLVELYEQDSLNERQALTLPADQAGRLAQLALEQNPPVFEAPAPALLGLIEAIKGFTGIEPLPAPANFPATLRPYQEEGLGWLQFLRRHGLGGILADDMGLGKTVQTLAHLVLEKQQGRLLKPSLIVAPVSVLGNWRQELARFAPGLTVLTLQGARRREHFSSLDAADVILIGYPSLLADHELLLERAFCFVILDEAQTIKNPRAKISQVAQALRAEHRLCLTGTPMENHLGELWSLLHFAQPGLLGDRQQFQRQYRTPIESGGSTRRAAALGSRVRPFLLRRTKDAVARDLPPRVQIVETIEFAERQRDFYDGIRLGMHRRVREAIDARGLARSHLTVLNALLKLRQACCDPRLVDADAIPVVPSAKLAWLSTVLPEMIAEGRRVLLFSQFTSMLSLIEEAVRELGIPYCVLTGETRARTEVIARFQTGAVPLFLISLKAGGSGLNLTAADTVIHYDPWWNPAVEAQATDRAHRIGQHKPVFVYKPIVKGTVEEKIMQLQADKHALVTQLYSEANALPSQLTSMDLEALFAA